jgi:hypothetical protein
VSAANIDGFRKTTLLGMLLLSPGKKPKFKKN